MATAAVVAGVSLLLALAALVIHPVLSSIGPGFGTSFGFVRFVTVGGVLIAGLTGPVVAAVLAVVAVAGRRAQDSPAPKRGAHQALVTGVLIAILVVSASAAAVLGLLVFVIGLDPAASGNTSGYLGFLFLYALLVLGAAEVAAAAVLTLVHRHRQPHSLPAWSAYLDVALPVAIAVACVGALLCAGMVAGVIVGSTAPAQILVFGLAAAGGLVWFVRHRHGRATTLRTRSFAVIVVAMVVPCLVLAALGVSAYIVSWDRASMLYWDQGRYGARVLSSDIGSLRKVPGDLGAVAEARLSREIVRAFANDNRSGALRSTMSAVRAEQVLPRWAIRSLERRGYAVGMMNGRAAPGGRLPDVVAWRVGRQDVRYFRADYYNNPATVDAPLPRELLGSLASSVVEGIILVLALGLLGAWILSRSVVRPVRRLAEASHRIADAGGAAEPVKPSGPRELRELANSFNDMNAKLAKAQETEQAFLLSVSHELKTPLTSIRGYAEGIGDGTVKPLEGAEVIGVESRRLERLVGDLLDSGRMRKSAFTVRREAVGLAAVADGVARRYEATAREAGLTLLVNTEAGGAAVADNDRLLQVVSNLVENAIRCTPAPGTVTITTGPAAITVADTGRGLTSDDLPRAFERFYLYSRYGTDRPVGTGLGLAIVKELTEAMDGTVSVSSALGVGTAFTVALPAAGEASPVGPATEASASPAAPAPETAAAPATPEAPAGPETAPAIDQAAPAVAKDDVS